MKISLIAAVADNRVIGADGAMPWRLSADLRRFKRLTMGHHLILGRKTYDSIGRALPGRRMVILTRGEPALPETVAVAASLDEALAVAVAGGDDEAFVAGGGEIYRLVLGDSRRGTPEARADRLYLTRVHAEPAGDVTFPDVDWDRWRRVYHVRHEAGERDSAPHTFEIWDRAR